MRSWTGSAHDLQLAGPNVLTITYDGFCNKAHKDNDKAPQAFGIWWTGPAIRGHTSKSPKSRRRFLKGTVSNKKVKGGGFYLPAYGVMVDFEGYVPVFFSILGAHICLGVGSASLRFFGEDASIIM